jgi:hypothetical protein
LNVAPVPRAARLPSCGASESVISQAPS